MVMTLNGLAKLTEEIGELIQVAGKKMAYADGTHPDGKGDLNSRMQEEMGDVVAAIAFVSKKLKLDVIAISAISEHELAATILNGLPHLAKSLGTLSYSASNAICAICGRGQKSDEDGILEHRMGLVLASINLVAKELSLDHQAIAARAARKVWQYESWDRQKP